MMFCNETPQCRKLLAMFVTAKQPHNVIELFVAYDMVWQVISHRRKMVQEHGDDWNETEHGAGERCEVVLSHALVVQPFLARLSALNW